MSGRHAFHRRGGDAAVSRRRRAGEPIRLAFESLEDRRLLVISVADTPNDDALSLESYGGPGEAELPGFDNVGLGSTNNTSVIYLGAGWVLTANHVTILNPPHVNPGGVSFGGVQYLVDMSTVHQLHNPNDTLADLKIFKIIGDPGLPGVLPGYVAEDPPALGEHVFMIGNGLSRGDRHFWLLDKDESPWVWTEVPEPPIPGPDHESGYDLVSPRRIRWGENNVSENNVFLIGVWGMLTQFDDLPYTGVAGLAHEAQASSGDSGGPVFYFADGKWQLSGVNLAVSGNLSGQPLNTTLFGSETFAADLSYYRDEILSIAGVQGRHVFYNNSAFDGHTPAISAADDGAIATDKSAYLPGSGLAGPENATSYSRGINGIMVDLASEHGALSLADFDFKVGANNTPSTWAAAPPPADFTVRPGAGPGESDRVEFIWPDGAITNTWLEVTVKGNDAAGGFNTNTALAASDIFYFGNIVGDTFVDTPANSFLTSAADEIEIQTQIVSAAPITSAHDVDRNGVHLGSDRIVARGNTIAALPRIDIGDPPPAPLTVGGQRDAGLAIALTLAATHPADQHLETPPVVQTSGGSDLDRRLVSTAIEQIFEADSLQGWSAAGGAGEALDALLESLFDQFDLGPQRRSSA